MLRADRRERVEEPDGEGSGSGCPLRRVLARNLRLRRDALGLSQEELAELSGLHRTNVSKFERELHGKAFDNLYWLAKALKVKPAQLLES